MGKTLEKVRKFAIIVILASGVLRRVIYMESHIRNLKQNSQTLFMLMVLHAALYIKLVMSLKTVALLSVNLRQAFRSRSRSFLKLYT